MQNAPTVLTALILKPLEACPPLSGGMRLITRLVAIRIALSEGIHLSRCQRRSICNNCRRSYARGQYGKWASPRTSKLASASVVGPGRRSVRPFATVSHGREIHKEPTIWRDSADDWASKSRSLGSFGRVRRASTQSPAQGR